MAGPTFAPLTSPFLRITSWYWQVQFWIKEDFSKITELCVGSPWDFFRLSPLRIISLAGAAVSDWRGRATTYSQGSTAWSLALLCLWAFFFLYGCRIVPRYLVLQVALPLHQTFVGASEPALAVRAPLSLVNGMLPDDFHVEIAPNRSKLHQQLRNRCSPPDREDLEIWNNAWDRFSIESFYQIPVPKSFPYHRADSVEKRRDYTLVYKREAVRRLLPKFKERHEFLTGKAERNVAAIISMLESWRSELPAGIDLAPPLSQAPS